MAARGGRPKAAHLHVVSGNFRPGRHARGLPKVDPKHDNGLEPPKRLKKRQQQLWDQIIRPCHWLTVVDLPKAHLWVELHVEWEADPVGMLTARIMALKSLGAELGLDPQSRIRFGADSGRKKDPKDPAEKYLT